MSSLHPFWRFRCGVNVEIQDELISFLFAEWKAPLKIATDYSATLSPILRIP